MTPQPRSCWCGAADLVPFGPDYARCRTCQTLVSQKGLSTAQLTVNDDDSDFYGKQYWFSHQQADLGFPDLARRARLDLTERNLHWLACLLKYRLPPARCLELGCAHGSFVALMSQAGYDALGSEMSPWVVDFGRRSFGIEMRVGPIEQLELPAASLDVIAMMDVLEHLPDPVATLGRCFDALRPDGLLIVQAPEFRPDVPFEALVDTQDPFLEQLKADEHLYLFSRPSVLQCFARLGVDHVAFEPAIFAHYDMFLVASRAPLRSNSADAIATALAATPSRRFAQALLDLRERELLGNTDRLARGEQITRLTALLKESETDRAARAEQIATLTAGLQASEQDRADRFRQIETLTSMVRECEASRAELGRQVDELTQKLNDAKSKRRFF